MCAGGLLGGVDINRHVAEGLDSRLLADAESVAVGKIILDAVRKERDRQRELEERTPKIDTENINEDIRFQLGVISALNAVLDMPLKARKRNIRSEP